MSSYDYQAVQLFSELEQQNGSSSAKISIPAPNRTYRNVGGISTISNGASNHAHYENRLVFNRCMQYIRTRAHKLPYVSLLCRHPSSICLVVAVFILIGMLSVTLLTSSPHKRALKPKNDAASSTVDLFYKQIPEHAPDVQNDRTQPPKTIKPVAQKPTIGWKNIASSRKQPQPPPPPPRTTALVLVEPPSITTTTTEAVAADSPDETARKRRFVRKMMKHAWDGYAQYAFGWNEISPASKKPHSAGIFGSSTKLGATIVDALDTLWIMGLRKEFERGRDWAVSNLNFTHLDADVSVFETNIRFMGGLLSAFSLSGDESLLQKAYELGRSLLPAFRTPTGVPWALYNVKRNKGKNWSWTAGNGVLAEFGTLHLEFAFLSNMTGDTVFLEKVLRIRELLDRLEKPKGLYPNYLNIRTGNWGQLHTSVGALGDSFYEYLFKVWLWSNQTDATAKRMYDESMSGIERELVRTSAGNHVYFIQTRKGRPVHQMDHLACFMGGLYALSAPFAYNASHYSMRGAQIADTCHHTYISTKTQLGPESFHFQANQEGRAIRVQEKAYYLRPETFETYFVLWRMTHNPIYRKWGWDAVQAIEKYCRAEAGYAGLNDVDSPNPVQDDVQQSFFLAETLKYLYLLFVDDENTSSTTTTSTAADDGGVDISLDEYVFNSEAHPLPIYGRKYFPDVRKYAHMRVVTPPPTDDNNVVAVAGAIVTVIPPVRLALGA